MAAVVFDNIGAAIIFVLGKDLGSIANTFLGPILLPLLAFTGGLIASH